MASLKTKILLLFLFVQGLSLMGQSFTYSYVDPCTKAIKLVYADMSAPIVIAYYGEVKAFTYDQLQDGTFDNWINNIYIKYQNTVPCQGVLVTTTTTTSTNQVSNIIGNVMNLTSLDFSSVSNVGAGVGSSVGSATNSGTNVSTSQSKKNENGNGSNSTDQSTDGNSNSTSGTGDGQGTGSSSSSSSSSSSGSSSGSGSNSGSGSGNSNNTKTEDPKTEKPSDQKIESQKTETQKSQSTASAKAASKAKVETSKPAILMTGDIVGIQTKSNGSQDARATMSFTRVKGDGTASIGFSADYMMNARIGNISGVKSWIGTNQKGNKHINVVSVGVGLMPSALSSTALFVRVNSLKNFTALYGAAGTYGQLYGEELISTIIIGGCMYKGKITKALDATIIMAGIYSPYSKYYTETILDFKPIVIPFINLNYKLTKTFGVGLTGGGTYVAGKDILNFQILMGAKLKL
jgi:hypothetical protein